jgi:hypothetical protein
MITTMSRFWRRRLAEDLDLPPSSSWYAIEDALIRARSETAAARADARRAERDRGEMQQFLTQAAGYWWEAGRAGETGPGEMPA